MNPRRRVADYSEAIRLNPKYAMAFRNRGAVLRYDKKEYDKAIGDYNEAIHLRPNDPTAYNNLGKTLKDRGSCKTR